MKTKLSGRLLTILGAILIGAMEVIVTDHLVEQTATDTVNKKLLEYGIIEKVNKDQQ